MKKSGLTPLETIGRQRKDLMSLTGLTLLEILVSAMIMTLVMVSLANIFLMSKRHLQHSRSKIQTAELGKLFLEPLQMDVTATERSPGAQNGWDQPSNGLSLTPLIIGRNCTQQPDCPPQAQRTLDDIIYNPQYYIDNVGTTELRRVKTIVSWNEPSF